MTKTYKVRWSGNPEVLKSFCEYRKKRGSKSAHLETDENGRVWYVEHIRALFHFEISLYEKMTAKIIKWYEEDLKGEK